MKPRLSAPLGIELKITNKCNLGCAHCIANSGSPSPNELKTAEIFRVIDQAKQMRAFYFNLTGGEPLLRRDVYRILDYVAENDLRACLTTNATLINSKIAAKIKKRVQFVRVSLDGSCPAVHEKIRNSPGSFSRTLRGILCLRKQQIHVSLLTVVSMHNLDDLENICDLCVSLGISGINFMTLVPGGRGENLSHLVLSPREYKYFLIKLEELRKTYKKLSILSEAPLRAVIRKTEGSGFCLAGSSFIFIMEDGRVTPCPYFFNEIGNIRESKLIDIWNNNKFLKELCAPRLLAKECKKCKYGKICFGGCRAAAFHKYGSISEPDPFCWVCNAAKQ